MAGIHWHEFVAEESPTRALEQFKLRIEAQESIVDRGMSEHVALLEWKVLLGPFALVPAPPTYLREAFGTQRPRREHVENGVYRLCKRLQCKEAVYFPVAGSKGKHEGWCFAGVSESQGRSRPSSRLGTAEWGATGGGVLYRPKGALAQLVGEAPAVRTEIIRRLWEYIRVQGLQDPKTLDLNLNSELQALFKTERTRLKMRDTVFTLGHVISDNLEEVFRPTLVETAMREPDLETTPPRGRLRLVR